MFHRRSLLRPALAAVGTLLLTACLPPPPAGRPAWVPSRHHPQYPPAQYAVGTGEGAFAEQAAERARADLSAALRRRVAAELTRRNPGLSGVAKLAESLGEPAGISVPLSWNSADGKRWAALAVASRAELAAAALEQATADEEQCAELLANAQASGPGLTYPVLLQLLTGLALRLRADEQRLLAEAVGAEALPPVVGPDRAALTTLIDARLSGLELRPGRGDGQKVRPGAVPAPLGLVVEQKTGDRGWPVENLPFVFQAPVGSGLAPLHVRTDTDGTALAQLAAWPVGLTGDQQVVARLDIDQVALDAGLLSQEPALADLLASWGARQTRFRLFVPGSDTTRLAVLVIETLEGDPVQPSHVQAELAEIFTEAGFDVLGPGELVFEFSAAPSPDQVAEALRGQVKYVIYGTAAAAQQRSVSDGLVFAAAGMQLTLLQVDGARVLASFDQQLQGAGRDLANAATRCLGRLGRKAASSFRTTLTERSSR